MNDEIARRVRAQHAHEAGERMKDLWLRIYAARDREILERDLRAFYENAVHRFELSVADKEQMK